MFPHFSSFFPHMVLIFIGGFGLEIQFKRDLRGLTSISDMFESTLDHFQDLVFFCGFLYILQPIFFISLLFIFFLEIHVF